ncbi:hypothetical protein CCR97_02275 [Rhodoplanes elegans]|uniref:hypothetical protein n=1 Tax=Rhodoplanes elegans TaxID=29408 RepID=UPI0019114475|nr:hypothetical protein [Rhodoplanes elegans]MBK5957044.1 hypothetical protein [Rhodoplanes elegans]
MTAAGKDRERAAREQRLSAALRENLKRRKAQSRARVGGEPPDAADPGRRDATGAAAESHDSAGIVTEKQSGIDG